MATFNKERVCVWNTCIQIYSTIENRKTHSLYSNTSRQSSLFQTSEVILSDAVSRGHFNMTKNKLLSAMTLNVDMNHFDYFVKIDHSIVVSRPWHIKVTKLHVLKGVGSFWLLFEQRLSIADSVLIDTVNLIGKS